MWATGGWSPGFSRLKPGLQLCECPFGTVSERLEPAAVLLRCRIAVAQVREQEERWGFGMVSAPAWFNALIEIRRDPTLQLVQIDRRELGKVGPKSRRVFNVHVDDLGGRLLGIPV